MSKPAVTEPFSLAGMGEMLRETNADLAAKTGVDEVEPPQVEPSPDPADAAPEPEETTPEPEKPSADAKADDEPTTPTEDELAAEQKRQADEAAEKQNKSEADAAAAQKAKDDDAKKAADAAAAKDSPEAKARDARDTDLNVNLSPNTHPKTRQIITSFKENARKARDERDTVARERDTLRQQLAEAQEKAKGVTLPKETEAELKQLREQVRELDITRDPALVKKYDEPMARNSKSAIDLLKSFGADQVVDPKDSTKTVADPQFEARLIKQGVSLKTLSPFIEKLEKNGYVDEAEQLRESVRENSRLARAKDEEINAWKGDYETRVKARTQQSQQQAEAEHKALGEEANRVTQAEISELTKTLPFLAQPPEPQATDAEPVRKAKQAALDEYRAAEKAINDAVNAFNPTGMTGEKARSAIARLNASAVLGVVMKMHALPRLQKDLASKDARIKDLETQITKLKGATNLSRQHATLAAQPQGNQPEIPAGAATGDAFAAYAKAAGVNINS